MTARPEEREPESAHLPLPANDIGAIAVDTNVYREYGFRVRSQPLAGLAEVRRLGINWLVPEFWERELRRHLQENAAKAASLQRELSRAREWANESQLEHSKRLQEALGSETAQEISERLLGEHFGAGRPFFLRTTWEAGPQVLSDYFDARDPFEPSGSKKSEFPDAFAIATLTAWARENNKTVMVVSHDAGCLRACASSEQLVGVSSLTDALAVLRSAGEGRMAVIREYERLLSTELSHSTSDLRLGIDHAIEKELSNLEFDIEYQEERDLECEYEITRVKLDEIEPIRFTGGSLDLRVFSAAVGELNFVCQMLVRVEVEAYFVRARSGRRARSYEYAAPQEETSGTIDLEVIVTLQPTGALSAQTLPHANVRRVELQVRDSDVDFGTIEAWEPEHEE